MLFGNTFQGNIHSGNLGLLLPIMKHNPCGPNNADLSDVQGGKYPALTQAQSREAMPRRGTEGQVCPWGQRTQLDPAHEPERSGGTTQR